MRYIKVEYLAGKSLASLGTSNRSALSLDTAPFQPNQRMLKVCPCPWFILIEICKRLLSSHCAPTVCLVEDTLMRTGLCPPEVGSIAHREKTNTHQYGPRGDPSLVPGELGTH